MEKEDNIKIGIPKDMQEKIGQKPPCMIRIELRQCVQDTNELALMFAMLFTYSKFEQVSYDKLNVMLITIRRMIKLLRKEYSDFFGDKGEEDSPKTKKLSEIVEEFIVAVYHATFRYKNESGIFWHDWKVRNGLATSDGKGGWETKLGPEMRLNDNVFEAYRRLVKVLEGLREYFMSVEKNDEDYTEIGNLLQVREMDSDRISYVLRQAEKELHLLKMKEPLEEERKEDKI